MGLFATVDKTDKRRRSEIFRNANLESYMQSLYDSLGLGEKLSIPKHIIGNRNFGKFLLMRNLDTKLALLNHLGKTSITIIFDDGMSWNDFRKAFKFYQSDEHTSTADGLIKKNHVFVVTPRAIASWMVASSLSFDTELYRIGKRKQKVFDPDSERLISTSERIEANKKAMKLLFRFLCAADALPLQLEQANLDFDQWVALGKLYFTNRPLNSSELIKRDLRGKALSKNPRGSYSMKLKYLEDAKLIFAHRRDKEATVYTTTTRGNEIFVSIMSELYDKTIN